MKKIRCVPMFRAMLPRTLSVISEKSIQKQRQRNMRQKAMDLDNLVGIAGIEAAMEDVLTGNSTERAGNTRGGSEQPWCNHKNFNVDTRQSGKLGYVDFGYRLADGC